MQVSLWDPSLDNLPLLSGEGGDSTGTESETREACVTWDAPSALCRDACSGEGKLDPMPEKGVASIVPLFVVSDFFSQYYMY